MLVCSCKHYVIQVEVFSKSVKIRLNVSHVLEQGSPRSDCANAQSDLGLACSHRAIAIRGYCYVNYVITTRGVFTTVKIRRTTLPIF